MTKPSYTDLDPFPKIFTFKELELLKILVIAMQGVIQPWMKKISVILN